MSGSPSSKHTTISKQVLLIVVFATAISSNIVSQHDYRHSISAGAGVSRGIAISNSSNDAGTRKTSTPLYTSLQYAWQTKGNWNFGISVYANNINYEIWRIKEIAKTETSYFPELNITSSTTYYEKDPNHELEKIYSERVGTQLFFMPTVCYLFSERETTWGRLSLIWQSYGSASYGPVYQTDKHHIGFNFHCALGGTVGAKKGLFAKGEIGGVGLIGLNIGLGYRF